MVSTMAKDVEKSADKPLMGGAPAGTGQVLQPKLNAFQGAALIAGAMVGSGVFTNPGKALSTVGATLPALLLWIVGALIATTASMMYAEWGSRITVSGGDAPFLDHAYKRPRRLLSILYGWTRVVLVNPGYSASLAFTAGQFLQSAFPSAFPEIVEGKNWTLKLIGAGILILQTAVCIPSNDLAGKFLTAVASVSVGSLTVFCGIGIMTLVGIFPSLRILDTFSAEHFVKSTSSDPTAWAESFYKVLWAFDGFSNLASSLGELRDPERNISRATFMGMGTVATLYVLANVTFFVMMPFEVIVKAESRLATEWGRVAFGPTGVVIVSLVIFLCVSACGYITLFSASRIGQATGDSEMIVFPRFFAKLSPRFGTPVNALVFNTIAAMVLLFAPQGEETFFFIVDLVSAPLWVFYLLTAIGLLIVKHRTMGNIFKRDPSVRGVQVSALAPILVSFVALFLVIFPLFNPAMQLSSGLGLCTILLGLVPYYILSRSGRQ